MEPSIRADIKSKNLPKRYSIAVSPGAEFVKSDPVGSQAALGGSALSHLRQLSVVSFGASRQRRRTGLTWPSRW